MDLFGLFTIGQAVRVIIYADEVNVVPAHFKAVGEVVGIANDFYRVDFGDIIESIDFLKLEAV